MCAAAPNASTQPKMLAFCESRPSGFDEHAEWLRRAIAAATAEAAATVEAAPPGKSDGDGAKGARRGAVKRPAPACDEEPVPLEDDDDDDESVPLRERVRARLGEKFE